MVDRLSFSTVQPVSDLKPNDAPNPITVNHIGGPAAIGQRAVLAILGDADGALEAGGAGGLTRRTERRARGLP